jgi:excisionase family DNA binding protein
MARSAYARGAVPSEGGEVVQFPGRRGPGEPWRTKPEIAAYLQVSERWIELRMKHDGFPHYKDPRSRLVRFRFSEVDAWVRAWRHRED